MKTLKQERGQILILFAFGLVGLLAFAALAIDGAMLYSTRRFDQGAADSAALAGASKAAQMMDNLHIDIGNFNCASTDVATIIQAAKEEAIGRAGSNNILLDDDISDQMGVTVTCGVNGWNRYLDIKVMVSSDIETFLIHMFYQGDTRTTVESVTRIVPRTPMAHGYGITSTSTNCAGNAANPEGVVFNGGINVYVNGAGIFSNSCMQPSNGEVCTGIIPEGMTFASEAARRAYICAHPGGISNTYMSGSNPCPDPNNCGISPVPQPGTVGLPPMTVPAPDCASLGAHKTQKGSGTISPGNYDEITVNNGSLTFNPGLYCIYGKGVSLKGDVTGSDVTFYLVSGDFDVSAGGKVKLESPQTQTSPAIKGMLVYMAEDFAGTIDLGGHSGSRFLGTVFAPDGVIKVHGTPGEFPTFNTELIALGVSISGNAIIDINYHEDEVYTIPPQLDLFR